MKLTASDFFSILEKFSIELTQNPSWTEIWNSDTFWSNYLLGSKRSSAVDSPIGNYFKKNFGDSLEYRSEDGSVDLSFFEKGNDLNDFDFYSLDAQWEPIIIFPKGYPISYLAIIEHENNIYSAWMEIIKLTYYHAPLKVLITYHSKDNLSEEQRIKEIKMLEDTMSKLLSAISKKFTENVETEYLLIVGHKRFNNLVWHRSIFDTAGNKIPFEVSPSIS